MKIYIVLSSYSDLELHINEFEECFSEIEKAYKYALDKANNSSLKQYYVIERSVTEQKGGSK